MKVRLRRAAVAPVAILLAFACGSESSNATAPDGGQGSGGGSGGSVATGGTGEGVDGAAGTAAGDAATIACAGLGCSTCASPHNDQICASGVACLGDTECASTLPGTCQVQLGTYTTGYVSAGCVGGICVYLLVTGGCDESRSCDQCREFARGQTCGLKSTAAECATCCETYYDGKSYAGLFEACACGEGGPCASACGTSLLCGGTGPETSACANCLAQTLLDGGACVASPKFQKECIGGADGGVFCKKMAQCLATCPHG